MAPPLFTPLSTPTPPPCLKALTPFIRHHRELASADPIVSYWCLYHAAQQGIATPGAQKDAQGMPFLIAMMDKLEEIKPALATNEAFTSDEVGSAHVENFALSVFTKADNEDRAGKASKGTAMAFQAAANFMELLGLFNTGASEEIASKRVYAKWKVTEILKALREGRRPDPGPPGWDPEQERREREEEQEALKAVGEAKEDDDLLAREIAKLTAPSELGGAGSGSGGDEGNAVRSDEVARVISPDAEADASSRSRRAASRLSLDAGAAMSRSPSSSSQTPGSPPPPPLPASGSNASISSSTSPNFSHPLRPQLERGLTGGSAGASGASASSANGPPQHPQQPQHLQLPPMQGQPGSPALSATSSTSRGSAIPGQVTAPGRPLPIPPTPPAGAAPNGFPGSAYAGTASAPPPTTQHIPSPGPSAPPLPPAVATPSAPPAASAPPAPPAPPAPAAPTLPTSLDARQTSAAQRYAKFAISALDFDDLETARRNLRLALDVVEGRADGGAKTS